MNKQITSLVSLITTSLIFIISLVFYFVLNNKLNTQYILVFVILITTGISLAGIITYHYFNYKVGEMFYLISSIFMTIFYLNQNLLFNLFNYAINNNFLTFLIYSLLNLFILINFFLAIYPRIEKKHFHLLKKPKKDLLTLIFGSITTGLLLLLLFLYLYKNVLAIYITRLLIIFILTLGSIISTYLYDVKLGKILSLTGFIISAFHLVNFLKDSIYLQFVWGALIKNDWVLVFFQSLVIGTYIIYLSFLFFKNEQIEVTILED